MSWPLFVGVLCGVVTCELYSYHMKKKSKKIDYFKDVTLPKFEKKKKEKE